MTHTFLNNQLRVQINLDIIKRNYQNLCAWTKTPIASVLKANAYGLGAAPIGKALHEAGCQQFFMATLQGSLELRDALPKATIYMLHGCFPEEVDTLVQNKITPVLNNLDQLALWVEASRKVGCRLPALVHFDTGMNRLGFDLEDAPKVQEAGKYINIKYVMSHLACADSPENPYNAQQRERLLAVAKYFPGIPKSLAASEGIGLGPDYYFDLLRVGISNYGIIPHAPHTQFAVRPQAQILQVRTLKTGDTIGYGQTYTAPSPRRVGAIATGFADGPMTRNISNRGCVYIGDYEAPFIGRVSMDLSVIDLTDIPESVAYPTIWVDLFRDNVSHLKLAEDSQMALYEITCNIGRRYQKIYTHGTDL